MCLEEWENERKLEVALRDLGLGRRASGGDIRNRGAAAVQSGEMVSALGGMLR